MLQLEVKCTVQGLVKETIVVGLQKTYLQKSMLNKKKKFCKSWVFVQREVQHVFGCLWPGKGMHWGLVVPLNPGSCSLQEPVVN